MLYLRKKHTGAASNTLLLANCFFSEVRYFLHRLKIGLELLLVFPPAIHEIIQVSPHDVTTLDVEPNILAVAITAKLGVPPQKPLKVLHKIGFAKYTDEQALGIQRRALTLACSSNKLECMCITRGSMCSVWTVRVQQQ